jgi:AAA+ ATPase superfamily predicted ATPase
MFVGREHELAELERLYKRGGFQMVVLYGRRRVGKTALTLRFAQGKPTLSFTAKVQSDAMNLADFSLAIYGYFGLPRGVGS